MNNQSNDNNIINNINQLAGEQNFIEERHNNSQQNQNIQNLQNINNNSDINLKENSSESNIQNLYINNAGNEDIILKINSLLQQNKFDELSLFLNLNKNKIPQNILSSYISYILDSYNGDPNILHIFLENGANVNTNIHSTNCLIEEKDHINLLMFSIIANNMDLFNLVIKYNPDILLEDKNKKNSLIYAILFNDDNNPLVLQELLRLNNEAVKTLYYDIENNITHNLLTLAASKNKKNMVELLLEYNCNINYQIPQTGETAMHLTVKNDNLEIAEILSKNQKYIKNIKNIVGETPKDICNKKKGKLFYHFAKEEVNHSNNNSTNSLPKASNFGVQINNNEFNNLNIFNNNQSNQNLNIQNFNNNNIDIGNGIGSNKKIKDKKDKFGNYNDINIKNMDDNEYIYNENNNQDNLIIPIEFQSMDYPTYLSMGQDIKLCLNIFQNEDSLTQQIEELEKQIKEKEDNIKKYEKLINNENKQLTELNQEIEVINEEIKKQKKNKVVQEKEIAEIKNQNEDFKKILKKLNLIPQNNEKNIEPAPNAIENHNENDLLNLPENTLTEEEFKILEEKFKSQLYEHNYIVKCLQKDLIDYQAYVKEQISIKEPVIKEILQELQSVVNEINSNYKVNLYGSYCTGLCLPWSDIDTVITCESGPIDEYFLSRLYYKLTNKQWVKDHKFIENTTIPIIKLVSNDKFYFHIDISVESEKHFGLKTVGLVKSYLKAYSVLEPIILALKTLLNNGNLNNPYTGGLSSYGLILMVVSFIQSEIDNEKYNENSPYILGETFLNILGHYGIFFDYNNYVIITYPVDDTNDNNDRDNSFSSPPNSHELIIVDPLNKQNNVAKSTFHFMNIKMGFLIAYMVAKEDCECGCHYECIQNKLDKTDHCILKRIFNSIRRFKNSN